MIHTYTAQQREAHAHRHQHALSPRHQTVHWARRTGKTYYALCEMLEEACAVPGAYAYLAPTPLRARTIGLDEFRGIVAPRRWSCAAWPDDLRGARLLGREEVHLPNGSVIDFSQRPRLVIGLVIDEGLSLDSHHFTPVIAKADWVIECYSIDGWNR